MFMYMMDYTTGGNIYDGLNCSLLKELRNWK